LVGKANKLQYLSLSLSFSQSKKYAEYTNYSTCMFLKASEAKEKKTRLKPWSTSNQKNCTTQIDSTKMLLMEISSTVEI
jgi:hypothetical protein